MKKEWAKASIMPIVIRDMNKVLQAAGRVIRTIDDVGVIELLDERFLQSDYRNLFPKEWEKRLVCTVDSVESYLEKFWEEKQ